MAITDPAALAAIVSNLGGTVATDTPNFQFSLPLGEVRTVVPKITAIAGISVRRVEGCDHIEQTASGPQTFVRLELFDKTQMPKESTSLLDLLQW